MSNEMSNEVSLEEALRELAEAEAELDRISAALKRVLPGAHSVYEALDRLAALRAERDALAAALEAVKPLLPHRRDYEPHPQHSTPCRACEILAVLRSLETMDLSPVLAARDREKDEKIAALAAALSEALDLLDLARNDTGWFDNNSPLFYKLFKGDYTAILAARDERVRREGAVKALKDASRHIYLTFSQQSGNWLAGMADRIEREGKT